MQGIISSRANQYRAALWGSLLRYQQRAPSPAGLRQQLELRQSGPSHLPTAAPGPEAEAAPRTRSSSPVGTCRRAPGHTGHGSSRLVLPLRGLLAREGLHLQHEETSAADNGSQCDAISLRGQLRYQQVLPLALQRRLALRQSGPSPLLTRAQEPKESQTRYYAPAETAALLSMTPPGGPATARHCAPHSQC